MPTEMKLQVQGAGLEPSSIEEIAALQVELNARAETFEIRQVQGNAEIKSKLVDGKLSLNFSPHFDYGINWGLMLAQQDPIQRFKDLGLTEEQAKAVVKSIEQDLDIQPGRGIQLGGPVIVNDGTKKRDTVSPKRGAEVPTVDIQALTIEIPLPNFNIPDIKPSFEADLKIGAIVAQSQTEIKSDKVDLKGVGIDDFNAIVSAPSPFSLDSAEVTNYRMNPVMVPTFGLSNIKSVLHIPRIGSSEIPINVESRGGTSDIKVPILDWHPRWRVSFSIKVLWKRLTIWVEFGVNLTIDLHYRWVITLLRVMLKLKDAFLNNITITLSIARVVFKNIKIGLAKFARLLYKKT